MTSIFVEAALKAATPDFDSVVWEQRGYFLCSSTPKHRCLGSDFLRLRGADWNPNLRARTPMSSSLADKADHPGKEAFTGPRRATERRTSLPKLCRLFPVRSSSMFSWVAPGLQRGRGEGCQVWVFGWVSSRQVAGRRSRADFC